MKKIGIGAVIVGGAIAVGLIIAAAGILLIIKQNSLTKNK